MNARTAVPDPGWAQTWRELREFAWALLLIDLIALGLGALAARPMGAFAYKVGVGLAAFVTLCFMFLIGSNLLIAWVIWWWRGRHRVSAE